MSEFRKVQIRGDMVSVLGDEIYYRLYALSRPGKRIYAINVTSGKETSTCCFGKDRNAALAIYDKIVEHSVTPCTLCYISEDFNKRK